MSVSDRLIEAIIAIVIIIVYFFNVLPELTKVTGFSVSLIYSFGVILLITVIISLLR